MKKALPAFSCWHYWGALHHEGLAQGPPFGVGVIINNMQYPVPFSGWVTDYLQGLDKEACGNYIYLCYRKEYENFSDDSLPDSIFIMADEWSRSTANSHSC